MTAISKQIYKFLCDEVVGSERVVKYRRLFFKTYEYAQNKCCSPSKYIIASGSKAEGLDLPGSDLDIMLVSKEHVVNETIPQLGDKSVDNILSLIIDYDNAQPGFVLLKLHKRPHNDFDDSLILRSEGGIFFSSNLYLQNLASKYPFSHISINGPCLSNTYSDVDVAHSLKCQKWPTAASKWLIRHRSSGWPSTILISEIVKESVLLVPIGSKSHSGESHPLEWRISFSVPEKKLIHTWTHTHMLCYALLKILIKDVLKKNPTISDFLCSYFLKTVIFWLSEELDETWWTPIHLLDCFVACLCRLTYLVFHKYIPNYFVPQHNMIERQFTQQLWDELLALMTFLHGIGWESLFLCDSLMNKIIRAKNNPALQEYISGYQDFNKAVIPMLGVFGFYFYDVEYTSVAEAGKKCICILTRKNLPTKVRIIFTIFLSRISQYVLDSVSEIDAKNKQMYKHRKKNRSTSLFLSKLAGVRGWVSLALNFYLCGQYKNAIKVLEYAKSISLRNNSIISSFSNIGGATQDTLHLYHFKDYIRQTRRLICHSKFKQTEFYVNNIQTYDYLLQLIPQQKFILLPTEVLIHYLRFACCHRLQDIFRRQQCLHDLTLIAESSISDGYLSSYCSLYLSHAYQIAHDRDFEQRLCAVFRTEKLLKSFSR